MTAFGSGHQGLWTTPQYPGDTVRELVLQRDGQRGRIAIRQYGYSVLVISCLPGLPKCEPGHFFGGIFGAPWPEKHRWCSSNYMADEVFDQYVQEAYDALWQNYEGESNSKLDNLGGFDG
jgi:hypothetical protein